MSRISVVLFVTAIGGASCTLLGAGEGRGSCRAPPYRAKIVENELGCPTKSPCCNEYGYCRTQEEWLSGKFRDCNGLSNGLYLPTAVVDAERKAAQLGDASGLRHLVAPRQFLSGIINGISNGVGGILQGTISVVSGIASGVGNTVGGVVSGVGGAVGGVASGVGGAVGSAAAGLGGAVGGAVDTAGNAVGGAVSGLGGGSSGSSSGGSAPTTRAPVVGGGAGQTRPAADTPSGSTAVNGQSGTQPSSWTGGVNFRPNQYKLVNPVVYYHRVY